MNESISRILVSEGFPAETMHLVQSAYEDPSRYYHNAVHIREMLKYVRECLLGEPQRITEVEFRILNLAVIFHDVVYDPLAKNNEEESAKFFWREVAKVPTSQSEFLWNDGHRVEELILATKRHKFTEDMDSMTRTILMADLDRFSNPSFPQVWEYTLQLFREYAVVDLADFMKGRIDFLREYRLKMMENLPVIATDNMQKIITAMEVWQPKIGVYAGSFAPFHKGHLNILEKANRIFDKVIIAVGINPDKVTEQEIDPVIRQRYQVDEYHGLLTDYIESKKYPVTVIRGVRNNTDLQYELNQYRWLQETMPQVNVVSLFADKEFEHVSSSGIKTMRKYKKDIDYVKFK